MNRGVHISRESGYTQAEIIALIRGELEKQNDKNFPIGYIWMSTVDTDPGTIVGGTWTRLEQGRVLLAAGSNYAAGSTGGEATHTLTAAESGQRALTITGGGHNHTVHAKHGAKFASGSTRGFHNDGDTVSNAMAYIDADTGTHSHTVSEANATAAHNNMQPYLAVYMWERTG